MVNFPQSINHNQQIVYNFNCGYSRTGLGQVPLSSWMKSDQRGEEKKLVKGL